MKKTVIKRRKRVPAVGLNPALAARQSSVNDTASPASQAAQLDEKPVTGSAASASGNGAGSSRLGSNSNLAASLGRPQSAAEREKERERHPANGLNSVGTNNVHMPGRPPLLPSGSSGASHASSAGANRAAATSVPSHLQNAAALGALGAMRGTSPARRLEISLGPRDKLSTPAGLTSGSGPAASSRSAPEVAAGQRPLSGAGMSGGGGGLYADALGLRNRTPGMASAGASSSAVPLNRSTASNGAAGGSERKKPWWIEPGEEDRRKASAAPKDTVCYLYINHG